MELVGSLEDLSLLDILQIVNVSRKTGILRIHPPGGSTSFIYFKGGGIQDIVGGYAEASFLRDFVEQGLLEESELAFASEQGGGDPCATLKALMESGALNQSLVDQAHRRELAARLRELARTGTSGEFAFFLSEGADLQAAAAPEKHLPLTQAVSPQTLLEENLSAEQPARKPPPKAQVEAPPAPPTPAAEPAPDEPDRTQPMVTLKGPVQPELIVEARQFPTSSFQASKNHITVVLTGDDSIFKNLLWQRLLPHFDVVERVITLGEYLNLCGVLLERHRPFISLVDLLMPTQDGKGYLGGLEILELSQKLYPQVKVILMNDLDDPRLVDMAKAKGAVSILQKPELGRLRIDQLEVAMGDFARVVCSEVDRLVPPVEEEMASLLRDLGAEPVSEGFRVRDQLTLLKGLMGELTSPRESSEISLLVLRLAAEYFERSVLFLVRREEIVGLGGFGETGDREMMMQKVRRVRLPSEAESLLGEAIRTKSTQVRDASRFTPVDRDFNEALGTHSPTEMAAIPMVSRGRVIALLYADNAVSGQSVPDISGIEIFMAQAGLAMEKALLERQLTSLKKHLEIQKE